MMVVGFQACNMDHHIPAEEPVLSQEDEIFLTNATYVNLIGIQFAALAEGRSTTGLILAYAQRMIEEHSTAGNVLGAMARDFEVNVPDTLPPPRQLERDRLADSMGGQFDSLFMLRTIENHQWSLKIMEDQINSSSVEELIDYARQQYDQIDERLNDALEIQSQLP